ncbi:lysylphosphatidylglycerol synthase domain-containing protein [Sphingobium lignivorans]|nr:lysylphosphatidylglycerol synthase domain-containing protein [Sphingobium lignivorans]
MGLLCLLFFAQRVHSLQESLPTLAREAVAAMPLAVLLCLIACIFVAMAWRAILAMLGKNLPIGLTAAIFLTTQFGKYLPGNIAQHIGRATLALRHGVPVRLTITSVAIEMAIGVLVMAFLGAPLLAGHLDEMWRAAAIAAGILALAALVGGFAIRTRRLAAGMLAARFGILGPPGRLAVPVLLTVAGALLSACALLLLEPALARDPATIARSVSIFCGAWVAGFLVVGAPAGLGVREFILSEGLAPIIGPERAIAAALLLRLVTTLGDLLAFALGLVLLRYTRAPGADEKKPRLDRTGVIRNDVIAGS